MIGSCAPCPGLEPKVCSLFMLKVSVCCMRHHASKSFCTAIVSLKERDDTESMDVEQYIFLQHAVKCDRPPIINRLKFTRLATFMNSTWTSDKSSKNDAATQCPCEGLPDRMML